MSSRRQFLTGTAGATVAIGLAGRSASAVEAVGPSPADIGFCSDMAAHHVQALAMCQRVLGRDTGDSVQAAAAEVLQNQAIEVGMMRAWLTDWGASTRTPEEVMAWMHDGAAVQLTEMPGYAAADQLRELSLTEGLEQGRLWLELMRAHHVGGVAMADAAVQLASSDKVIRLAETQTVVQSYEIGQYDLLLGGQYAFVRALFCEIDTETSAAGHDH